MKMNEIDRVQHWNELAGTPREFDINKVDLYAYLINEEYEEFTEALHAFDTFPTQENYENLLKELADLLVVTIGEIHSLGQSATKVLAEVNDSNFSKFPRFTTDGEMRRNASYISEKYGGIEVSAKRIDDRAIFRREDGKILKPLTYQASDMSKFKLPIKIE